jgi:hypothetical protein
MPANTTANATEATLNAARTAQASATSYYDSYAHAMGRVYDAAQRLTVAYVETAFRVPMYGLNVYRQLLDEATRTEASAILRPNAPINAVRYALDETVELQREARKLVDEVANTVKVGQDAAIELTEAHYRLAQSGLNYRNGTGF